MYCFFYQIACMNYPETEHRKILMYEFPELNKFIYILWNSNIKKICLQGNNENILQMINHLTRREHKCKLFYPIFLKTLHLIRDLQNCDRQLTKMWNVNIFPNISERNFVWSWFIIMVQWRFNIKLSVCVKREWFHLCNTMHIFVRSDVIIGDYHFVKFIIPRSGQFLLSHTSFACTYLHTHERTSFHNPH